MRTDARTIDRRFSPASFLERHGVLVAFAALVLWSGVLASDAATFRRPENIRNIFNQNAATGVVAVGMTLVIVAGGIDLSVGSVMALASAIALITSNALIGTVSGGGWSEGAAVFVGLAAGLATGAACGAINGGLVTLGRIPAFIATLGGLVAYRSITLALAEAGEIRSSSQGVLQSIGRGGIPVWPLAGDRWLVCQWSIVLFLLVAAIGQVVLSRTRYGRQLVAVGGNETAARYSAIAVDRVRLVAFIIVGFCAALAGLMQTARMNSVSSSQLGLQMELDAIAAVVIGGTSMTGGKGRVWATVVGVLILAIINNMLVVAGVSVHWQGFVKGVIIVLAVLIQRGRRP
ncbi:MAG: ABC transporter permease [Phycisphaerales bacterium]